MEELTTTENIDNIKDAQVERLSQLLGKTIRKVKVEEYKSTEVEIDFESSEIFSSGSMNGSTTLYCTDGTEVSL